MEFSIERATIDDIGEIAKLFNDYRIFYEQPSDLALATDFLTERINNDESVIFYARDLEGNYVGFTQLYPGFCSVAAERSWTLYDLFVAEEARCHAIGKTLLNKAREFVAQTPAHGISLQTGINNFNAQRLYESLGYERDTEFYNYFLDFNKAG